MTDVPPRRAVLEGRLSSLDNHDCPGCGDPLPPPSVPYGKTEHDGATWHAECAFADSDDVEKVDTPRYCRNCHGISKWHPVKGRADLRVCFTCLNTFRGPIRDRPDGPPFDRTDEGGGFE